MKYCTKFSKEAKPAKEYSQKTAPAMGKKAKGFSGRPKGYETQEG
jgi:hypothetical protein